MFKRLLPVAVLMPLVGLSGCLVDDSESTDPDPRPNEGFQARYVPLGQMIPFPNDLALGIDQAMIDSTLPCTEQGLVNYNVSDNADLGNPLHAMNCLDGFSTTASAYLETTDSVDEESFQYWTPLDPGNVVMVNVTDPSDPQILTPEEDYRIVVSDVQEDAMQRIHVEVLKPLDSDPMDEEGNPVLDEDGMPVASRYMLVMTNGIQSTTGNSLAPTGQFRTVRDAALADQALDNPQLEQVRQAIQAPLMAATGSIPDGLGYDGDEISAIWTMQTQSTQNSLRAVASMAEGQEAAVSPTGLSTGNFDSPVDYADIWAGFLDLPYFLDEDAPVSGFWTAEDGAPTSRFNPIPQIKSEVRVPLFMTSPSQAAIESDDCPVQGEPEDGWPVVIFQHGIQGNRTQALALADTFGCFGYMVAAIDHPLHGLTSSDSPLYVGPDSPFYEFGVRERHFYMVDEEPTDPAEHDNELDASGSHYINLSSMLTSRDNLRQSVADLLHLSASVSSVGIVDETGEPVGMVAIDPDRKFFVGHSLGGIAGASLTGLDDSLVASVLGMPGGKITDLLQVSDSFGPQIRAGLEAQNPGLVEGSTLFDNFFRQAQTVIDAGDPANYGALSQDRNVFMIEVDGDTVVPNQSTQYLSDTVDLEQVSTAAESVGAGGRGLVRYLAGNHGSLLAPGADDPESMAVWASIQCHTAFFIASADDGTAVIDADGSTPGSPDECGAAAAMGLIE